MLLCIAFRAMLTIYGRPKFMSIYDIRMLGWWRCSEYGVWSMDRMKLKHNEKHLNKCY